MPRDFSSLAGTSEIGEPIVNEITCPSPLTRGLGEVKSSTQDCLRKAQAVSTTYPEADWGSHSPAFSEFSIKDQNVKAKRKVPFFYSFSCCFEVAWCPQSLKSPSSRATAEEICDVTPPPSGKSGEVQHHRPRRASHTSDSVTSRWAEVDSLAEATRRDRISALWLLAQRIPWAASLAGDSTCGWKQSDATEAT